ncbi:MAG: L,D-transpeptidase [Oscillospiraceae bacterium]|nr:L,D-transpeptidase [Oscillospiraceae bacterium]
MSTEQIFILKKEIPGAELSWLIKLNRGESRLEIYRKCDNEKLYDDLTIQKSYDSTAHVVFEKAKSFPSIFGREATPTPEGIFHIEAKSAKEYISAYYPNYSQVKFFGYLVIFEDYFIHSDLYKIGEDIPNADKAISLKDKATSGCIRVPQKNLSWLIDNIDVGTLVLL